MEKVYTLRKEDPVKVKIFSPDKKVLVGAEEADDMFDRYVKSSLNRLSNRRVTLVFDKSINNISLSFIVRLVERMVNYTKRGIFDLIDTVEGSSNVKNRFMRACNF